MPATGENPGSLLGDRESVVLTPHRGDVRLAVVTALVFLLTSCRPDSGSGAQSQLPDQALARVGSTLILTNQFIAERARRGGAGNEADVQLLEDMIRRELLFSEARRIGFDRSEELQKAWKNLVIQKFLETQETAGEQLPQVTSAEVDAHYQKYPQRYQTPSRVHAALIQVSRGRHHRGLEQAEAVRGEALRESRTTADFGPLAARHSVPGSVRQPGGDLGWLTRAQAGLRFPPEVVAALFTLDEPGEVSPVVVTAEGMFLVKLIRREESKPVPLAAVREAIAYELKRTREQAAEQRLFDRLRELHPVEVRFDRLTGLARPDKPEEKQTPRTPRS